MYCSPPNGRQSGPRRTVDSSQLLFSGIRLVTPLLHSNCLEGLAKGRREHRGVIQRDLLETGKRAGEHEPADKLRSGFKCESSDDTRHDVVPAFRRQSVDLVRLHTELNVLIRCEHIGLSVELM
jgi:hypothetical protein